MTALKTMFSIDLRTLALFRIGLGFCLLMDLSSRAQDLMAHYSDDGVLPRADLKALGLSPISFHAISGSTWVQALLFIAAACAALALLIGLRTRLATFVSWVLLASLVARNTLLVQGGDNLLLVLLFWSLFLPLGARYSVDAAVNRSPPESSSYWSMATTALLVQVMALFFFSALLKSGPEWIPGGTAIAYVLQLDYFARPVGVWLRDFPSFTRGLTFYVWYLELLAPLLIFSPFWFAPLRWAMFILLVTLQLALAVCLNVGLFPLFCLVALIVFLPPGAWHWFERWIEQRRGQGLTIYYDGDCEFCRRMCLTLQTFLLLKHARFVPAQTVGDVHRIMEEQNTWVIEDQSGQRYLNWDALAFLFRSSPFTWVGRIMAAYPFRRWGNFIYRAIAANQMRLGRITGILCPYHSSSVTVGREVNLVVGILMVYMLLINIQSLPMAGPKWANRLGKVRNALSLNQRWDMFTPGPPKMDVWCIVRGELLDGTIVDVLNSTVGEPSRTQPGWRYPTYRWEKYLSRLALAKFQPYRPAYGNYLCRQWDESHRDSSPLRRLWLYILTESNELDGRRPRQETLLLHVHSCPSNQVL